MPIPARAPSLRVYLLVWIGLLLIVGVEVALTFAHVAAGVQLAGLLALASLEAAIALLYFMHLRYERRSLFWSLIPALVAVLILMDYFWPDAVRLLHQRLQGGGP
jgi:cytochrome c oxidase subunit 4